MTDEPAPYKAERQPAYTCNQCGRELIVQIIARTANIGASHPCVLGCGRILGLRGRQLYLMRAPHPYEIPAARARDD